MNSHLRAATLERYSCRTVGKKHSTMVSSAYVVVFGALLTIAASVSNTDVDQASNKKGKLSVLEIVRFDNEPCLGTSGRNGTCYTSDECAAKGGTSAGTCASSFGVCCIFTVGCGSRITENCTYFTSGNVATAGRCQVDICKCSPDICQIRLDFLTFVITGPSTRTSEVGKGIGGTISGNGPLLSDASQCQTDTFSVTGPQGNAPPVICGVNSGQHVYVDAIDGCNMMTFQLGQATNQQATLVNRQWDIKVSQLSCSFENLAPQGCTQYYYGSNTNTVQSFNFAGNPPYHLANQKQKICIRREANMCRICWTAAVPTDVQLSGNIAKGFNQGTICCSYTNLGSGTNGYDCIMIPGATKKTTVGSQVPNSICGRSKGLVTLTTGMISKTVCSMRTPFELEFFSDMYENSKVNGEATKAAGFRLNYVLSNCA